jgi:hypothetical protein
MADTNYGSTLTKGGTTVGKCMIIDFPEISTGKAVTTNHAGGGVAESIPNGLISLGDITLSVILEAGTLAGINTDIENKSVESIVITDNIDDMTFQGYYLSVKPEPADAENPDTHKATVVIACTGAVTIDTVS